MIFINNITLNAMKEICLFCRASFQGKLLKHEGRDLVVGERLKPNGRISTSICGHQILHDSNSESPGWERIFIDQTATSCNNAQQACSLGAILLCRANYNPQPDDGKFRELLQEFKQRYLSFFNIIIAGSNLRRRTSTSKTSNGR